MLTIYDQEEVVFEDGIRRIKPIFIRPIIDRTTFGYNKKDPKFEWIQSKHTNYMFNIPEPELRQRSTNTYKQFINCIKCGKCLNDYKDFKLKYEFKGETKDIKLFIKPELKLKIKKKSEEEVMESSFTEPNDQLNDDYCDPSLKRKDGFEDEVQNKKYKSISDELEINKNSEDLEFDLENCPLSPINSISDLEQSIDPMSGSLETVSSGSFLTPELIESNLEAEAVDQLDEQLYESISSELDLPLDDSLHSDLSSDIWSASDLPSEESQELDLPLNESSEPNLALNVVREPDLSLIESPEPDQSLDVSPEPNLVLEVIESDTDLDSLGLDSCDSSDTVISNSTEVYELATDRQSFYEQFDTKLTEHLLSYLSLKDRLRFECVCKEWQKILLSQQKSLIIRFSKKFANKSVFDNQIMFDNIKDFNECSIKLLRKFTQLRRLEIEKRYNYNHNISQIIETVNQNQLCLERVRFWGEISEDILREFGLKFGDRLKSIDINSGKHCMKNSQICRSKLYGVNVETVAVYHQIKTLRAKQLPLLWQLMDVDITDVSGLEFVANAYRKQIRKINFSNNKHLSNRELIEQMLVQLSRFKRIESFDFYISDVRINKKFIPIVEKCRNLRELHIYGERAHFNLKRLRSLDNLRVLGLFFDCPDKLSLRLSYLSALDLTELWIYYDVKTKELEFLAEMKNLTKFHIKSNHVYSKDVCEIMAFPTNLCSFYVEDVLIKKKTIKAIVRKATENPSVHYSLISDCYEEGSNPKYELNLFRSLSRARYPKNVSIIKLIEK